MHQSSSRKLTIIKRLVIGLAITFLYFHAKAGIPVGANDSIAAAAIKVQIAKCRLNYPYSVQRFYKKRVYQLGWIAPDTVKMHALDAMLLLDCLLQYGLSHQDFHPKELTYDQLHLITELNSMATVSEKAAFDVLLTDAMITFINHLHYGKLNPKFPATKIDRERTTGLRASNRLADAINSQDFMTALLDVQPKTKAYRDLQDMMRLMTAQYIGDCYEVPVALIRKVALNLERLRWSNSNGIKYHLTCVVKDGILKEYPDNYHLDKDLENALYLKMNSMKL